MIDLYGIELPAGTQTYSTKFSKDTVKFTAITTTKKVVIAEINSKIYRRVFGILNNTLIIEIKELEKNLSTII